MPDGSFIWTSSVDGPLGIGKRLDTSALSVGVHTIVVSGQDTAGHVVSDSVRVEVAEGMNSQPRAAAGPDLVVPPGFHVRLDGSASLDVDGDPLQYEWRVVGWPSTGDPGLTKQDSEQPDFFSTLEGTFEIELVVHDGEVASIPDRVVVEVSAALEAAVDLELLVNGQDADESPGFAGKVGQELELTYTVANTGDVPLDVQLSVDAQIDLGVVEGDDGNGVLDTGEIWTYTAWAVAEEGEHLFAASVVVIRLRRSAKSFPGSRT